MLRTNGIVSILGIVCVITVLMAGSTCPALAQQATGKIIGTVRDQQGGVIPGATVTAINAATQVSSQAVTNADGNFEILALPLGSYRLSAENPGFKKIVSDEKTLQINQVLRVDLVLEVGSTTEEVVVSALSSAVETVAHTLGQSVTSRPIVNLPLNGRNVLNLALLQPGVTETTGPGNFSVAGGRGDSVNFILDGGMNNNLLNNTVVFNPNPDTVAEFRILTSNYTPEYGRNGGGTITVVTRSGTNQLHGTVFEFLRNENFNANSFFNNRDGLPKEVLKRNQFGFTVGGPITIPKLLSGKDRFFFFVGYQGQRQTRAETTATITTFTPAELKGDFSLSNRARNGPHPDVAAFLARYPFFQPNRAMAASAIIDPSRIDPVAQKYIASSLIPTSANGQLKSQGSARDDADELTLKFDFNASTKDKFAATLGQNLNPRLFPFANTNVAGYPTTGGTNSYFANISYTRIISPMMLNEFRYTAQRRVGTQAVPGRKLPTPAELGIAVTPDNPVGPTRLSFLQSGLTIGFSPQGPTTLVDNTFTFTDTFSWVKGNHSMKFGATFSPYQDNTIYDFYVNGNFFYSGPAASGGVGSGFDFADFLLGLPDEYLQFPEAPSDIRTKSGYWFAQDEWKVTKNFVLTFGVRYEYSQPKYDTRGRSFSLKSGAKSSVFTKAPVGLLFPGDADAPKGSNFPDKNDWAPRLGFAWDPWGKGKTSLRGGFGVFFDILKGEDNLQFNGQAPFFGFSDLYYDPLTSNPTRPLNYHSQPYAATGVPNSFPSKPPAKDLDFDAAGFLPVGGGGVYYVEPNLRTPYIYQYNLSLQHEILRNVTVETSYIGNSSHKLTGLVDANAFVLGTTQRRFNALPGNNNFSFSFLDEFRNVGTGNYNAFALSLHKRYSENRFAGMSEFLFAYTFAHGLDNVSGFRQRNSRVPYYNSKQFRSSTDFDIRHRISFSGEWELPFDRMWNSGWKTLTRGWRLSPIVTWRTGFPLDVLAGLGRARTRPGPSGAGDSNLVRANLVGSSVAIFDNIKTAQTFNNRTGNFYFDPNNFSRTGLDATCTACATNPALRTYGTLPRNFFRAPGRANVDLGIAKRTSLGFENITLEFRAEFFNLFNKAHFLNPNTSITSTQFGQISTTADPRIIQFGLKLGF